MAESLLIVVKGAVATLTLARPAVHNALDGELIGRLTQAFQKLGTDPAVRVVVLEGQGTSFCAGADIAWMRRAAALEAADNARECMALVMMFDAISRCPKPVLAVVQGAALGGGVGLVAAADMAIAAEEAFFALGETRLGIDQAPIAPYVVAAMGERACRRYFLSGERFDAREASRLGLIHAAVAADRLEAARDHLVEACLKGAPKALASAKELLRVVVESPRGPDLMRFSATRIAEMRVGDEAREGLAAFIEKRKPNWG